MYCFLDSAGLGRVGVLALKPMSASASRQSGQLRTPNSRYNGPKDGDVVWFPKRARLASYERKKGKPGQVSSTNSGSKF